MTSICKSEKTKSSYSYWPLSLAVRKASLLNWTHSGGLYSSKFLCKVSDATNELNETFNLPSLAFFVVTKITPFEALAP